jgi:hypothetical protein
MISREKLLPVLAAAFALLSGCSSTDGPLVGYDVTGTGSTEVTYFDGEKSLTEHVKLPWHKEFHVNKKKFLVQVQAGGAGGQGEVTSCVGTVDNQQVVHATPLNPAFPFVLCSHQYEAK